MLDDGHRRLVGIAGQLVHQPPGGVAVEQVEVGQLLAAVLLHLVPPARRTRRAVARPALVRVLAVAQQGRALQGEMDGRGQHATERLFGGVAPFDGPGPPASSQATMAAS